MLNGPRLLFLLAFAAPFTVFASDSHTLAQQLGAVMAAEAPCFLTYDSRAIEMFIRRRVKPDNAIFADDLYRATFTASSHLEKMSQSSKIAYCTQERRVAKSIGFVR
jgi:hypothetical protein